MINSMNFRNALLIFCMFFMVSFSCTKKETRFEEVIETSVSIDKKTLTLDVGDQAKLTASFDESIKTPKRSYKWISSDANIVSVSNTDVYTATITANNSGVAQITLLSSDNLVSATCEVRVNSISNDIVRILAIGNSFSEDALEFYLNGLASAAGKKIIIGNLFIGGAALSQHLSNATNNANAYSYRKIDVDGKKTTTDNTSIATALKSERWDYVSFQQASPNSGQYETYVESLAPLYNYVKANTINSNTKYLLHQTWAYASNSTHAGFANYNRSQATMYNAIIDAVDKASKLIDIYKIIPAGTAIQNGRMSVIGDNFNRDGYHLDVNIGRYTAAAAWFEALFGQSVIGNSYKPDALSDFETALAQNAAHFAVSSPKEINPMTEFQAWPGGGTTTNDIYIGFGPGTAPGWNVLSEPANLTPVLLKDNSGNNTGLSIELVERFNDINTNGPTATTIPDFDIPPAISSSSFFGNSRLIFSTRIVEKSVLKIKGLDKTKKYKFSFFASRMAVNDNRETAFVLKGSAEKTLTLNATKNTSMTVRFDEVEPDLNGEILITVKPGANNDNTNGFFYINALKISQ